ncbi:hypothetical protein ONE63_011333 [Megalurothrips usitatus]|uniref:Sterile alpha motif domain-containing protein 3-like n=1 Tax=Megalurothrips usitatus TaxID=439358 RepID=A0AAV7X3M2_9NEOP|nr:hypothetical protein ONE63_011333 [Megalurothrips usitatus]
MATVLIEMKDSVVSTVDAARDSTPSVERVDEDMFASDEEDPAPPRPRVCDGPIPHVYELPNFGTAVTTAIREHGRSIDMCYKERIIDALRADMMRYSCYVYPVTREYQRVVDRLLGVYPCLSDASSRAATQLQHRVDPGASWKKLLRTAFRAYRRKHGHRDEHLAQMRAELGINKWRKAPGGSRVYQAGERAYRGHGLDRIRPINVGAEGPSAEDDEVADDEATMERIRVKLAEEWARPQPNSDAVILRLNCTASARRRVFRDRGVPIREAFNMYAPLRDPRHLLDDVERFYNISILDCLTDYFTPAKCARAVSMLKSKLGDNADRVCKAYNALHDTQSAQAIREFVLLGLPLLAKEHLLKWVKINTDPTSAAPTIKIECPTASLLESTHARYFVIAEGVVISGDRDFSFTEAVACLMAIVHLCDLKWPHYITGTWRFLAEEVCGFEASARKQSAGTQGLINIFD